MKKMEAELAILLLNAREEAAEAKRAFRELAERLGDCNGKLAGDNGMRCFDTSLEQDQWCTVCKQKQPLWKNYHTKANVAGAALRKLLKESKRARELNNTGRNGDR